MHMCYLRVVLFVKGNGADASSYKPNRDDSQWWQRRDALVRCVAAYLFLTAAAAAAAAGKKNEDINVGKADDDDDDDGTRRELVLLFDEDWSVMYMKYNPSLSESSEDSLVPMEQTIISLWKQAASAAGKQIEKDGLTCRLQVSPQQQQASKSSLSLPTGMDKKRDILQHMQTTCSLDFLRSEGLNSSSKVVLRKTNKKTLIQSWYRWVKEEESSSRIQKTDEQKANESCNDRGRPLEHILASLLQPVNDSIQQVVAGMLHESSENELPYWNQIPELDNNLQICLFVGAVRDMSVAEKRCLRRVCCRQTTGISSNCNDNTNSSSSRTHFIPLLAIRLGPVPEFTSKILSVVAFHASHHMLAPSIRSMLAHQQNKKRPTMQSTPSIQHHLHFICLAPFASAEVSADLNKRNRSLWCLVRCTVTTLWRSRFAGQQQQQQQQSRSVSSNNMLTNQLTIMFEDGISMTLYQEDLVTSLAEQHQAAPSEHQILKALCDKLARLERENAQNHTKNNSWKEMSQRIMERTIERSDVEIKNAFLLQISSSSDDNIISELNLVQSFYSQQASTPTNDYTWGCQIIVTIPLQPDQNANIHTAKLTSIQRKQQKSFQSSAKKLHLPVVKASFLVTGQDHEAATIAMLQHFAYQNRLIGICRAQQILSNKKTRK